MSKPLVTAMVGMTIGTTEPDGLIELLNDVMGWEKFREGAVDSALERLWGIEAGSAGESFAIYRSPGADRGMIRVISGRERERTRPMGIRWSGVEIVVMEDLDGLHAELESRPQFTTIREPTQADFEGVGANIHRFCHGRAPGGTHLMYTMEVTAPTGDYDFPSAEARVGHIFDIPLVTDDYARAFGFYRDELGMVPMLEDRLEGGLWHYAWSLPEGAVVDLSILKGDAPNFGLGGIELQGYDSRFIDPIPVVDGQFDGGACLATYTTRDIDAIYDVVSESANATVISEPQSHDGAPYGGGRAFCFAGPGGERFEICESPWA